MTDSTGAMRFVLGFILVAGLLAGCATNPVTGSSELGMISEQDEIRMGQNQYGPGQQSQGGPYRLDPALSDYVSRVGMKLARVSDRPELPWEFVILDSSVPNAWALPGGKIAVNRGLLYMLGDESELAAVLGHEIVHAAARHGARQQEKSTILGVGLAVLGVATANSPLQGVAQKGAELGSAMVQSHYGRADELEADRFGMQYMARAGYDPQGAVRLQQRFVQLSQGREQGGFAALFASHPPSQERVDANRERARTLPPGIDGRADYRRAVASLMKDKPAFEAYDKGVKAMNAGKFADALALGRQAIRLQPRAAPFHELEGYASEQLDRPADAIASYNRAIALNQSYYRPYLLRGMLQHQRGNLEPARQDLETANRLLPTAEATYYLGEIAARQGDNETALRYFEPVARSQSGLAPRARDWIARITYGG